MTMQIPLVEQVAIVDRQQYRFVRLRPDKEIVVVSTGWYGAPEKLVVEQLTSRVENLLPRMDTLFGH